MMKQYLIETIINYPDNGKHQKCYIGLPFQIRKGVELKYNIYKNETKIDERWICHLTDGSNESLDKIFEIKASKDLDSIIKYCVDKYMESVEMEMKRIKKDLTV